MMAHLQAAWGAKASGCLRAAVIGAGNMGAGIAAQFANAGIAVDLLDIAPALGPRNGRALAGIANQLKAGGFMGADPVALVRAGNLDDDLDWLAEADWIIEAVIEDLQIKRDLYARIEPLLKPGAVISSNTSTIPREALIEGRSAAFADAFVISHFFNPPRHMALLEIVAPPASAAGAFAALAGKRVLGKTVIDCRDTPGFIANRIGCTWMAIAMVEAVRLGLSVEQADAVHVAFGLPRTGIFGLADLVGIDLIPHVWGSLMRALPAGDTINRFDLPGLAVVRTLLSTGRLGRKSGAGFYRRTAQGKTEVIDLITASYGPATGFAAADLPGAGRDLDALIADETGLGAYARAVLSELLRYAADHSPAIAPNPEAVDTAMELGYAWRMGPFRLRDGLSAASLAALGLGGLAAAAPAALASATARNRLEAAKAKGNPLASNAAATLWPLGDGLACLELTTKMNAIDSGVLDLLDQTLGLLGGPVQGLVIGNTDARAFSAGANLTFFAGLIAAADWAALDAFIQRGQTLMTALRHGPVPSVAAIRGVALGGGCELALHCSATLAHAEARIGLPEHQLGLLPAWGGTTRLLQRALADPSAARGPVAGIQRAFDTLLMKQPAASAREAATALLLAPTDPIAMYPGDVLDAAADLLAGLVDGYRPPAPLRLRPGGPSAAAGLLAGARARHAAGGLSAPDLAVMTQIAGVLTGGPAGDPTLEVGPEAILELERLAFVTLARDPLTPQRISHMLKTGKPLKT